MLNMAHNHDNEYCSDLLLALTKINVLKGKSLG